GGGREGAGGGRPAAPGGGGAGGGPSPAPSAPWGGAGPRRVRRRTAGRSSSPLGWPGSGSGRDPPCLLLRLIARRERTVADPLGDVHPRLGQVAEPGVELVDDDALLVRIVVAHREVGRAQLEAV